MSIYSYCILSRWGRDQLRHEAEEDMKNLPANSVPADPLISSSSSGAIDPSGARWESNNVEVYDGTAIPDF